MLDFTSKNASFSLLTVATRRKNISNGIKGLVILQKGEYSHDFTDNTLLVCCFSSCWFSLPVDMPLNVKHLTLQSSLLNSVFLLRYFLWSYICNLVLYCFI